MDPNRTIEIILNSLLAGGGLAGVIAAVTAYKSRRRGEPGNETAAIIQSNAPDWAALNAYWKQEVSAKSKELERVRRSGEQRAASDAAYIDALEAHIWRQLPPPPPPRKEES